MVSVYPWSACNAARIIRLTTADSFGHALTSRANSGSVSASNINRSQPFSAVSVATICWSSHPVQFLRQSCHGVPIASLTSLVKFLDETIARLLLQSVTDGDFKRQADANPLKCPVAFVAKFLVGQSCVIRHQHGWRDAGIVGDLLLHVPSSDCVLQRRLPKNVQVGRAVRQGLRPFYDLTVHPIAKVFWGEVVFDSHAAAVVVMPLKKLPQLLRLAAEDEIATAHAERFQVRTKPIGNAKPFQNSPFSGGLEMTFFKKTAFIGPSQAADFKPTGP